MYVSGISRRTPGPAVRGKASRGGRTSGWEAADRGFHLVWYLARYLGVTMGLRVGSPVMLITPDNPRLDRAEAVIKELTDWGAHVATKAAATGNYRAAWSEMVLLEPLQEVLTHAAVHRMGGIRRAGTEYPHGSTRPSTPTDTPAPWNNLKLIAKDEGYTGDECSNCGSMKMRRNGTCLLCENCGTTSGCS